MARRAFVILADWPFHQLSDSGKLTWCCTAGTENHLGIFVPCTTAEEAVDHSEPRLSHPSARGAEHVAFDYMIDRKPRFQSYRNTNYYTKQARVWLFPIVGVDAAAIHAACVEVAREAPINHFCFRCNALCWCWPYHCWCSNTDVVGPSTCVALTLRIIARAKVGSAAPYVSDAATFAALGIERFGASHPCAPGTLTGYSPRAGLEALQRGKVVGRPVEGFAEAIAQCRGGGPAAALGSRGCTRVGESSGYPLLPLAVPMSRA